MHAPVETNAWISVARGCGFAGLATVCGMVGLSFDPPQALKFGGYSALITTSILLLMAWRAPDVRYSRTETWIMLDKDERPPRPIAQSVISRARQRVLYWFANVTAKIAVLMLAGSLGLGALVSS
ncbi:MAG: hypothetical protein Q8M31_10340 [Beijerinckiaceae bacterium]|nr:hypothetical protein [Beijerinckiaceae bacterium]